MSNRFDSIIGQEHIREHLRVSLTSGKISQAYLVTGENMSGKEYIARIFANALVCDNPEGGYEPCGKCKACIQAASGNHPDIITVTHEKPGTISVDDVREQIVNDEQIKPYQSKRKIYIMNEARMVGEMKAEDATQENIMALILQSGRGA